MSKDPIPESADSPAVLVARVAADLRRAIKAQGLKQRDVAARLGISEPAVSRRLGGDQNLTLASIQELAALSGLSVTVTFAPAST